jgi:hypothetical protein
MPRSAGLIHPVRRQILGAFLASCLAAASCSAETLRELLVSAHVPVSSFSDAELQQTVQGITKSDDHRTFVAYQELKSDRLAGVPHLISYSQTSLSVLRANFRMDETDVCAGSIGEIRFAGGFKLLSTEISPSAECLLVVSDDLKTQHVFYGFSPVEVSPGLIVLIENMIHFAPVHPERLQLASLRDGKTLELYPVQGDALRAQLITEHAKHLPTPDECARMNDPCRANEFDEDIRLLETNRAGLFAFLAFQSASHATIPGQPPVTVASQAVLYIYKQSSEGWHYCEEKIAEAQVENTAALLQSDFARIAARCTPDQRVVPDNSTAAYNPFRTR